MKKTSKYRSFYWERTYDDGKNVEVVSDGSYFNAYSVYGVTNEGLSDWIIDFPAKEKNAMSDAINLKNKLHNSLIDD